jgi:hypothetical protein
VAPETLSRLAGCLVLVLAAGWCGALLGSGWWPADSASALTFLVPFVAACGGLGGTLLAPRHRLPGLLGGAVGGAGSACVLAGPLGPSLSGNPLLGGVAALAGLLPGAGAYCLGKFLQRRVVPGPGPDRFATAPPAQAPPPGSGPRRVIYEVPVPEAVDVEVESLEEALLALCRGQRRLFDRLLAYERRRQPYLSRGELVRLAIERYANDNR